MVHIVVVQLEPVQLEALVVTEALRSLCAYKLMRSLEDLVLDLFRFRGLTLFVFFCVGCPFLFDHNANVSRLFQLDYIAN